MSLNFDKGELKVSMQISHQHELIIFSQYGSYCRIDSYGDIPGQVVSLFDLRIWTLKSALSLYSGLGLLVVKKFPSEGERTVREANGQSNLRFSQVFWTLVLAMTLSHNFLKMQKHVKGFYGTPVFSEEAFNHDTHCSNSLSQIFFSAVLFWRLYIHFGFFFSRWQWSTIISAIAAIRNSSSTFPFCFSAAAFSVDY